MPAWEQLINQKKELEQLINDKKELLQLSKGASITDTSSYYQYTNEPMSGLNNDAEMANLEMLYLELERINAAMEKHNYNIDNNLY